MSTALIPRRIALFATLILLLTLALPLGARAEDPVDRVTTFERLYDSCEQGTVDCNLENCNRYDYSGCLVDCRGCSDPLLTSAFREKYWSWHPSYGACVVPLMSAYVAEVQGIQAAYLERSIKQWEQEEQIMAATETAKDATATCRESACLAHCADLGVPGRLDVWDCICEDPPADGPQAPADPPIAEPGQVEAVPEPDGGSDQPADQSGGDGAAPGAAGDAASPDGTIEKDGPTGTDATTPDSGQEPGGDADADAERPRLKTFRIRPIAAVSFGELVGHVRVRYELQEVYDDGTTGRRCTLQFSGWGAMVGLPVGFSFAPGYQWSEFDVRSGRMRLEDFDQIKGYHSSAGGVLGGWSGMHFGTAGDAMDKRAETAGSGWNVGLWLALDWTWGTWEIVEGPR